MRNFSPDSARVASGAWDGTLHIFDIASGSLILERSVTIASEGFRPTGINAVAFSLDGTRVLTVDNHGEICTWDVTTGRLEAKQVLSELWGANVSFSPVGACLPLVFRKGALPYGRSPRADACFRNARPTPA